MSGGGDGASGEASSFITSSSGGIVKLGGDGCLHSSSHSSDAEHGSCSGDDAMAKEEMAEKAPEESTPPPPPPPPPPTAEDNAARMAEIAKMAGVNLDSDSAAKVEKVVLSGRALFPYDSAQLTGQGNREMTTLIDKLRSYSDIELIDVVGHADSRGATDYNQALSERRAETVKGTLQGAFPQVPITASGLGETAPISSNDTAEGRRLNRRVEIRVEAIN